MCLMIPMEAESTNIDFVFFKEVSNPYLFKIYFHESIIYDISVESF